MSTYTLNIPLYFTQDFLPERSLLSKLLSYAQSRRSGSKEDIGNITGIPTGNRSGKVEAILFYALGMGLITARKEEKIWSPTLTTLGELIHSEDPYLSEPLTLWLLHLMMCRRRDLTNPARGFLDAWFTLFSDGDHRLGRCFTQQIYIDFLIERHGIKKLISGLSGIVLRSYFEQKCFGLIRVLTQEGSTNKKLYTRCPAPSDEIFFPAYTTYFFLIWDNLFAEQRQLDLDEIDNQARLSSVLAWDKPTFSRWLLWMSDNKILQLDRQTGGTLVLRLQSTAQIISGTFKNLI